MVLLQARQCLTGVEEGLGGFYKGGADFIEVKGATGEGFD